MAIDRLTKSGLRNGFRATQQLLNKAKADADPVSVFIDGQDWGDTGCAIFIVKGGELAKDVHQALVDAGLVAQGKVLR